MNLNSMLNFFNYSSYWDISPELNHEPKPSAMNKTKNMLFLVILLTLLLACNNDDEDPGNDTSGLTTVQPTIDDTTREDPEIIDSIPDGPGNCMPNPNGRYLNVTLRPQEENFWCWAASGEMVMEKLGATITQCDEANKRFRREDCCNSPDDCDRGGWPQFEKYGYTSDTTNNEALSWEDVKKQIDCRRVPFCVTWRWVGNGGHMMVISAYKSINGENQVKLINPLPVGTGSSRWIRYSEYVSGPDYTHWDDFFNIRIRR